MFPRVVGTILKCGYNSRSHSRSRLSRCQCGKRSVGALWAPGVHRGTCIARLDDPRNSKRQRPPPLNFNAPPVR